MKLKDIFTEGQTAYCLKTNFGYGGKSEVFETTIQSVGRKYITDGRGQMFELREDGFMHLKNTITSPVLLFPVPCYFFRISPNFVCIKKEMRSINLFCRNTFPFQTGGSIH